VAAKLLAQLAGLGVPQPSTALLTQALTHRSASKHNYERLEFLGDAIVDFICADCLCSTYPEANEGELSRIRAALVDQATLASCARELNLSDHLILGSGELKSGGYRRDSILADVFEALVAAIYRDCGLAGARKLVEPMLRKRFSEAERAFSVKDGKSTLQEWLQARGKPRPEYTLVSQSGPDHDSSFVVRCLVDGFSATGNGVSLKRAEQSAADSLLNQLCAKPLA